MYYLYNQQRRKADDESEGSAANQPISVVSQQDQQDQQQFQHRPHRYQRQQLPIHHLPALEEVHSAEGSSEHPESHQQHFSQELGSLQSTQSDRHFVRRRRNHHNPDDEKVEQKDNEQSISSRRTLSRRRGLEENDYTEEVMQPQRPRRVFCHKCQAQITKDESSHRIVCVSKNNQHEFCQECLLAYIGVWVDGKVKYELRRGKGGANRWLHFLPCMSSECKRGYLSESNLKPLLTQEQFVRYSHRLAQARKTRSEEARSSSSSSSPSSSSPSPPRAPQRPAKSEEEEQMQETDSAMLHTLTHASILQQEHQNESAFPQHQSTQFYPQNQHLIHSLQPGIDQGSLILNQSLQQQQQHLQRYQQLLQQQHHLDHHRQRHFQQRQILSAQENFEAPPNDSTLVPMPTVLRRDSTANMSNRTGDRVSRRTSFANEIGGDDDNSTGSSVSSLTTRFPIWQERAILADAAGFPQPAQHLQHGHGNHLRQQLQQPQSRRTHHDDDNDDRPNQRRSTSQLNKNQVEVSSNFASPSNIDAIKTCECCYEDYDTESTLMLTCCRRSESTAVHRFCVTCFRSYVEEWLFGTAAYTLRPGKADERGHTALVLPCLYGDCSDGGFPDHMIAEAISERAMARYKEKMIPLRTATDDDDDKLMSMAIRLSLEEQELQKRLTRMHEDQLRFSDPGLVAALNRASPSRPPSSVHVPMTSLSNVSSMTSINQSIAPSSRRISAATGYPAALGSRHTIAGVVTRAPDEETKSKLEKSIHEVEEAMTQAKIRQCPRCFTKYLKDKDFCNKLKCPQCTTVICFICRQELPAQGYDHFCIHKKGGCAACHGVHCPLWTTEEDDEKRDREEMRTRGLDEANRIWEQSLLDPNNDASDGEIRVDVHSLLQQPPSS